MLGRVTAFCFAAFIIALLWPAIQFAAMAWIGFALLALHPH